MNSQKALIHTTMYSGLRPNLWLSDFLSDWGPVKLVKGEP